MKENKEQLNRQSLMKFLIAHFGSSLLNNKLQLVADQFMKDFETADPSPTEQPRNEGMKVYEIDEVNDLYINDNTAEGFKEWLENSGYKLIQSSPSPDKPNI